MHNVSLPTTIIHDNPPPSPTTDDPPLPRTTPTPTTTAMATVVVPHKPRHHQTTDVARQWSIRACHVGPATKETGKGGKGATGGRGNKGPPPQGASCTRSMAIAPSIVCSLLPISNSLTHFRRTRDVDPPPPFANVDRPRTTMNPT
jgi:hypothetical protein